MRPADGNQRAELQSDALELLKVAGVAAVQSDSLEQPLSDATTFIGAADVWPTLGGQDMAASNVVVGVIDTGIWPESDAFKGGTGIPVPAGWAGTCQAGPEFAATTCNVVAIHVSNA